MAASHEAIRVRMLKQAEKESRDCGYEPETIGLVFADSWKRLRETPGTKLRRLTSTPGYDFRLRIGGGHRAVASVAHDVDDRLTAYIHEVEPRRDVYNRDAFGSRLKAFWGSGSGDSKRPDATVAANYRELDLRLADRDDVPHASLNFWLQLQQQEFFDQVLPLLEHERKNHAQLVIGHGPPGSGKTLVACDLALEAVLDGHDVDILVPSVGLEREYVRFFKAEGVLASKGGNPGPGVRVWRFPEFFADIAGIRPPFDRESRVRAWCRETLREPRLAATINKYRKQAGGITDHDIAERLPLLIDALLEDEGFWEPTKATESSKDRLAAVFEQFRSMLSECREAVLDSLEEARNDGDHVLVTRSGLACGPAMNALFKPTNPDEDPPRRLMIVDEAQDLAPSEWRRLLELWFGGQASADARRGRLVLLGDLDQRVSLVPFHWNDVKNHAQESLQVERDRIEERQVDSASYRMRENIARFAATVFDKGVTDQAKVRRHGRIDYDKLLEGGEVHVAIVDRSRIDVKAIIAAASEQQVAGEHIFMIHGTTADASGAPEQDGLFLYSVRESKGLEADRIVVVHPLEQRLKHKPRAVTADEATEYYTAISRAREHVLLVIDKQTAKLLAVADEWKLATVHEVGDDTHLLRALAEPCRTVLSTDEVRNELVRQLNHASSQPGDFGEAAYKRIIGVLRRLAGDPDDDLVDTLLRAGEASASTDLILFRRIRDWARDELAAGRKESAIAALLFAGELVLAERIVKGLPPDRRRAWNPDWLALLAAESCWQAWRADAEATDDGDSWTPDLLERLVYRSTVDRIRTITSQTEGATA